MQSTGVSSSVGSASSKHRQPAFNGLLAKNNPLIGTFSHAPLSKFALSKFFKEQVMEEAEYYRQRSFRYSSLDLVPRALPFVGSVHQFAM